MERLMDRINGKLFILINIHDPLLDLLLKDMTTQTAFMLMTRLHGLQSSHIKS